MNKKSATITWFRNNYGSSMQAFSLQTAITALGIENELINYQPSTIEKMKFFLTSPARIVTLKAKISNQKISKKFVSKTDEQVKKDRYEDFYNKYLKTTQKFSSQKELKKISDTYDFYFCGSDQIWNPAYFKKCQFLEFVNKNNVKIAYAPSIGTAVLSKREKNKMVCLIKQFQSVSTREKVSAELLQPYINQKIEVVCDPVYLLQKEKWEKIFDLKDGNRKSKYILCYFLGNSHKYWSIAKKLVEATGYEIKIVPNSLQDYEIGYEIEKSVGPIEWISLMYNAELILTDSFHATSFSLIFNKNFYTLKRFADNSKKSQNSRIYHILSLCNLQSRVLDNFNEQVVNQYHITNNKWEKVNTKLNIYRCDSLAWLKNSIGVE